MANRLIEGSTDERVKEGAKLDWKFMKENLRAYNRLVEQSIQDTKQNIQITETTMESLLKPPQFSPQFMDAYSQLDQKENHNFGES